MESKPDTIKVSATHKEEISANRADLYVTVKGSSLVSGDAVMKKAKEVNQLVEALKQAGVEEEAIHLQGVHIETSSGALLKSSSATYRLKIQCEKLDSLAELLDIISEQKNATLERIAWKYNEDEARERGLLAALEKAKSKADKVAKTMGVKILGVYDLIENSFDEDILDRQLGSMQAMPMRSAGKLAPEPSLGMDIQHSKTVNVNVEIWYRVSAL